MIVLETARLALRRLTLEDAPFILRLLNEPSFLEFIGDKGARDLEGARGYLRDGPLRSYEEHGFGLYLTALRETGEPIGICGLVKRDTLDDVEVGFAFVPEHWSKGYAYESAEASIAYARDELGLRRVAAITTAHNESSIRLLERLGMHFESTIELPGDPATLHLFVVEL